LNRENYLNFFYLQEASRHYFQKRKNDEKFQTFSDLKCAKFSSTPASLRGMCSIISQTLQKTFRNYDFFVEVRNVE
jgi:hypothetical protein